LWRFTFEALNSVVLGLISVIFLIVLLLGRT